MELSHIEKLQLPGLKKQGRQIQIYQKMRTFALPYLTKKNSFKIKGFPENGGVLNIKPRFH